MSAGYFLETYNERNMMIEHAISTRFVQDNESCSCKNVIRGLHYQLMPYAQAKLVRVVSGSVIDFVLDIRKNSKTFGKTYFVYLSGKDHNQFYIPSGFAHGFLALEDNTIFSYKCDNFYDKNSERGINLFDESLNIINNLKEFTETELIEVDFDNLIVSEKDMHHPNFIDAEYFK